MCLRFCEKERLSGQSLSPNVTDKVVTFFLINVFLTSALFTKFKLTRGFCLRELVSGNRLSQNTGQQRKFSNVPAFKDFSYE